MTLIDPASHWWNRAGSRRRAAVTGWILGAVLTGVASWAMSIEVTAPATGPASSVPAAQWSPAYLAVLGIGGGLLGFVLVLGGIFFLAFGPGSGDLGTRDFGLPIAFLFVAMGVGGVVARIIPGAPLSTDALLLGVAGLVAVVVVEVVDRRGRATRRRAAEALRVGIETEGVVTSVWTFTENYVDSTRVTVRFVDTQGRNRWHEFTHVGQISEGDKVGVRYLPHAPQDRGGVVAVTSVDPQA